MWLTKLFYDAEKKAISDRSLDEVVSLLSAKAQFESPEHKTFLRVGGTRDRYSIDLGADDGLTVILTAAGWRTTPDNDTKLVRSAGFAKLPAPVRGGELNDLKRLLNLEGDTWVLALAFLLLCLRPNGGFMVLLIEGEQGSGKSFLCMVIKKIIDPNQVEKGRLPDSERDLMIHAKDYFLLSFDNVSGMKGDISDALCKLATGGGFGTRKLYTDDEQFVFNFCRPIMINGIADFVNRPDLLERSIPLRLPAMSNDGRRTEEDMLGEIEEILPGVLGCLYEIVSRALGTKLNSSIAPILRMADCERWLTACEPHTGLEPGSFVKGIRNAQDEIAIERAQNDAAIAPLLPLLKEGPFEGTVAELHQQISSDDHRNDRYFPPTPAHLSKHLTRLRPAMKKAGIFFEFGPRTHQGRQLRVWLEGQEGKAATRRPFSPGFWTVARRDAGVAKSRGLHLPPMERKRGRGPSPWCPAFFRRRSSPSSRASRRGDPIIAWDGAQSSLVPVRRALERSPPPRLHSRLQGRSRTKFPISCGQRVAGFFCSFGKRGKLYG